MRPVFPRINLALSSLIELRSGEFIYKVVSHFKTKVDDRKHHNQSSIDFEFSHAYERIEYMVDEVHQVIRTSDYSTVEEMFNYLKAIVSSYSLFNATYSSLEDELLTWNEKSIENYQDRILKESSEYHLKPERTKYKHLEKYEKVHLPFFGFLTQTEFQTSTEINYNYFCVDFFPELIDDKNAFEIYLNLLEPVSNRLESTLQPLIDNFDAGKYKPKQKEGNFYDRLVTKAKNNKLVVGILIGIAIMVGINTVIDNGVKYYDRYNEFLKEEVDSTEQNNDLQIEVDSTMTKKDSGVSIEDSTSIIE